MEKRIRNYEKFIAEKSKKPTPELWKLHCEMLRDFQHERLVHLFIMLFFILVTLGMIAVDAIWTNDVLPAGRSLFQSIAELDFSRGFWVIWPMHILTLLLFVLSVAYVKHYHFLENHIQKLYDYNETLVK